MESNQNAIQENTPPDLSNIVLTDEEIRMINETIGRDQSILLQVTQIRELIAQCRLRRAMNKPISTKKDLDTSVATNAVEHNLNGLMGGLALSRPELLVGPLFSVDAVRFRLAELKFLSVGPRSESELLILMSKGVLPKNIRGLDLISYSPFVDLGDMHAMPYENNSFDVIILGWVLAYSRDPEKAAREALRVAKPGAIFAIGCEYNPLTSEELMKTGGYLKDDYSRFYETQDIFKLFGDRIGEVYFEHNISPEYKNRVGSIMTVFRLKA